MPTMPIRQKQQKFHRIRTRWVVYNHIPGGQVVVQNFKDIVRKKKVGNDQTEEVEIPVEMQIRGFKDSDFIALYRNGKLVKNELLEFPAEKCQEMEGDPSAATIVHEWARTQGVERYFSPDEKKERSSGKATFTAQDPRVDELSKSVEELREQNAQLKAQNVSNEAKIDQILSLLQKATSKKDA